LTKSVHMGAKFVFVKASQRLFKDADFEWNWQPAKTAGLLRGAYHFLTWDVDPRLQAQWFWSIIKNDPGELPPVADYESRLNADGAINKLLIFLQELERLSGRVTMIYTSRGFWAEYGAKYPGITRYPLWIANYGVSKPISPLPWTNWQFWQYSCTGDGLAYGAESKGLDLNWFNGTLEELYAFAGIIAKPEPTDAQKLSILWKNHFELH
jgi:lysozyme